MEIIWLINVITVNFINNLQNIKKKTKLTRKYGKILDNKQGLYHYETISSIFLISYNNRKVLISIDFNWF